MFDWHQYLDIANDLVEHPSAVVEAGARTAVSRAYYAAFHHSRVTLERELAEQFGSSNVHGKVIRGLRERSGGARLARELVRLLQKRVHADYDDEPAVSLKEAALVVEMARRFLREFR